MRVTRQGNTGEGNTERVTQEYPAVIRALADLPTRAKLRRVCDSLQKHGVAHEVRYGTEGPTMDVVSELLEAL